MNDIDLTHDFNQIRVLLNLIDLDRDKEERADWLINDMHTEIDELRKRMENYIDSAYHTGFFDGFKRKSP